jgi:chemotaxis protein CheD
MTRPPTARASRNAGVRKSVAPASRTSVKPARKSLRSKPRVSVAPRVFRPTRGFEKIHHHWDAAAKSWIVQILPGEYYVTNHDEIIATVLGSCVSTCIRDRELGLGGMNHFMLPEEPGSDKRGDALRYGCFALERLINELLERGARKQALEIKVFGGGRVIAGLGDIGRSNYEFVRGYLADQQLTAAAEDVGGPWARRLRYHPRSGKALVKHLPMREAGKIGDLERDFREKLKRQKIGEKGA